MYMRSPAFASQLPAGKTWLRDRPLASRRRTSGVDFVVARRHRADARAAREGARLDEARSAASRVGREGDDALPGASSTLQRAARAIPAYGQADRGGCRRRRGRHARPHHPATSGSAATGGSGRCGARLRRSCRAACAGTATQTITFLAYDVPVSDHRAARGAGRLALGLRRADGRRLPALPELLRPLVVGAHRRRPPPDGAPGGRGTTSTARAMPSSSGTCGS